jgi:Lhr-like helicase
MEEPVSPDLRNIRFIIVDEVHAFVDSERGAQSHLPP